MTSGDQAQGNGADVLAYKGQIWNVESKPEVIEVAADGSVLVEVWVRRGEGNEQPQ